MIDYYENIDDKVRGIEPMLIVGIGDHRDQVFNDLIHECPLHVAIAAAQLYNRTKGDDAYKMVALAREAMKQSTDAEGMKVAAQWIRNTCKDTGIFIDAFDECRSLSADEQEVCIRILTGKDNPAWESPLGEGIVMLNEPLTNEDDLPNPEAMKELEDTILSMPPAEVRLLTNKEYTLPYCTSVLEIMQAFAGAWAFLAFHYCEDKHEMPDVAVSILNKFYLELLGHKDIVSIGERETYFVYFNWRLVDIIDFVDNFVRRHEEQIQQDPQVMGMNVANIIRNERRMFLASNIDFERKYGNA